MSLIYQLGIFIYGLSIRIAALFNEKAKLFYLGRKNIFLKLNELNPNRQPHLWFHFASLGEFEQGKPVIEKIKQRYPTQAIAISFFSPSGYEIRKNDPIAHIICYLPLDNPSNAEKFIEIINPSIVFFTKYDYWYFYFKKLNEKNIPLYMISSIFRKEQLFFKWYGSFYRKILSYISHFFVQNEESIQLLKKIGYTNVSLNGDTRFDRVYKIAQEAQKIEKVTLFCQNHPCIVAGSTWHEDEQYLAEIIPQHPDWKWIMAPHQIDVAHLNTLKNTFKNINFLFYSEINENTDLSICPLLIIDNIGLLASLYQYGKVNYVGGGFGTGIHNTLEAITFGAPVVFGPKYHKFQEAKDMIQLEIAKSAAHPIEINESLLYFMQHTAALKPKVQSFIESNRGASDKIISFCFKK